VAAADVNDMSCIATVRGDGIAPIPACSLMADDTAGRCLAASVSMFASDARSGDFGALPRGASQPLFRIYAGNKKTSIAFSVPRGGREVTAGTGWFLSLVLANSGTLLLKGGTTTDTQSVMDVKSMAPFLGSPNSGSQGS